MISTLAAEADIRVFDQGRPTDVVDTSAVTAGGRDLVGAVEGALPHPLAATAPGPDLATLLAIFEPVTLTDSGLIDYVTACDRIKAWADALAAGATTELVARCARLEGVGSGAQSLAPEQVAAAELAPALVISPTSAAYRVSTAELLAKHPATRESLAAGRIDAAKARAIAATAANLPGAKGAQLESRALARAPRLTLSTLRAWLRRALLAADPTGAEERHREAASDRRVWREADDEGMSLLQYYGPSEQVEATYTWVTALARTAQARDRAAARDARARGLEPPPVRTLDQCRADVLADLGVQGLAGTLPFSTPAPTREHGRDPQVHVVVAASTLMGLDDEPAELVGVGPITAEVARRFAAESTWRRLVTDPATGALLDLSAQTYAPPQQLRDLVVTRDRTCRGLGCRMPATRCDLDHTVEWPCGPTCPGNLCALCRAHHRLKTLTATRVVGDGRGGLTWTMPSGKTYHRPPDPVLDHPDLAPDATGPPGDDLPPF